MIISPFINSHAILFRSVLGLSVYRKEYRNNVLLRYIDHQKYIWRFLLSLINQQHNNDNNKRVIIIIVQSRAQHNIDSVIMVRDGRKRECVKSYARDIQPFSIRLMGAQSIRKVRIKPSHKRVSMRSPVKWVMQEGGYKFLSSFDVKKFRAILDLMQYIFYLFLDPVSWTKSLSQNGFKSV